MNQRNQWARFVMYREARAIFEYSAPALDVLEVSGTNFCDLLPWKSYRSLEGVDVVVTPLWPVVDLVVFDQVLEHVHDPARALARAYEVTRPGGWLFVSTPFFIKPHPAPYDYWRWTQDGLSKLISNAGYKDCHTGQWGNRACMLENLDGWVDLPRNDSIGSDRFLQNDPTCPVTVWATARG